MMLKNYIKIAFRNIVRNKIYSFINVGGLAIAIATCVLIGLYVSNQESYDSFNVNANRIVRATMVYSISGVKNEVAYTGNKLLPAFERNFPEVESGVRFYDTREIVKYADRVFDERHFVYADSTFFRVFSFRLLRGNPAQALARPFSVVLTASAARKYFGREDPIGKLLRVDSRHDYTVTGVTQDCPTNSQIKFDLLASFCSLSSADPQDQQWWNANYFTYLLLRTPQSVNSLRSKIPAYMKTQDKGIGLTGNDYMTFHLQPLERVHLYPRAEGGFEPPGDYRYVMLFSIIGLLVLGIACANYINMTIAKAAERAREVGVRKVVGALRRQLAYQFIGESFITVLMSSSLGLALAEILLPLFDSLSGETLQFSISQTGAMTATFAVIILFVGLLGGGYPAVILSGFQPIKVLKGNFKTSAHGLALRKTLIVTQFAVSAALIVSTFIIHAQMGYVLKRNLGFNKNDVAVLPVDGTMAGKIGALKSELLRDSNIRGVTVASRTPVFINSTNQIAYHRKKIEANQIGVDPDFIETLGVQLIAGSNFTATDTANYMSDDSTIVPSIIVNETALSKLGLTPDNAVGKLVAYGIGGRECMIRGVVKDFYFSSMRELIKPLVLFPGGFIHEMMVRVSSDNLGGTVNYLKRKWNAVYPDRPFELTFLNDDFNRLYASETKTETLFYMFSALAVALGCLGLFGLSAFSAQQRTKEIGVRKALGARPSDIVALLTRDYIPLLVVSNIIAWPLAWYAGRKWLEGFAYRTHITPWIFVFTALFMFAAVLATVSVHAIRAARTNPIRSLRYE